jgi:hypothetical protein
MSTTREQRIEDALQKKFRHHRAITYPLMTGALLYAERELAKGNVWLPTWRYTKHGILKATLDKLEDDNLVEVVPPHTKLVWSERLDTNLFDPDDKERAFLVEVRILLNHAKTDIRVKQIITHELRLDPNTSISDINAEFLSHLYKDRLGLYGKIIEQIKAQGLTDIRFDHKRLHYKSMCNRYSLSKMATSFLSGIT